MKNFATRKNHIRFYHTDNFITNGESLLLCTTKEAFISIERSFTIEDFLATVHEYSHATSFQINVNHHDSLKELFVEIDSFFMELLAADFYNSISNDTSATFIKAEIHNTIVNSIVNINLLLSLIELESTRNEHFKNNKDLRTIADTQLSNIDLDELLLRNYLPENYPISYMFAVELYKLYKQDKEKALYILKKLILLVNSSKKQYYDNIKKLGLIPNLSLQTYQNSLENEVNSLIRKKHHN